MEPTIEPYAETPAFKSNWGLWLAVGAVMIIAGIAALVASVAATIAVAVVLGVALIASGIVQIGMGLRERSWRYGLLFSLWGIVEIVIGAVVVFHPAAPPWC
ncbi:hypothetical protein CAI21_04850 [Alkalilimnicola ehrlichii]|uniref:DUF308 domain-containing protein n=1 Tax=Alkalilimnicola ehrlichii TaxID=351052 RepID=UPI000E2FB658|nr:DUF308 domain-containing protein [Alkalilimnicola ehrlichii]RFA30830.1 hypothetical protein CAI21_04850 [Alkalilimnicola ehrlichii]